MVYLNHLSDCVLLCAGCRPSVEARIFLFVTALYSGPTGLLLQFVQGAPSLGVKRTER
jgi:hypothetical protein